MNGPFQKNDQWFAATLKSMGEAVIATDNAEAIIFMNAVAETLTGWTMTEALGKNILFLPSDDDIFVGELSPSDIVIQLCSNPLLISRNGDAIPIEYNGAPIKDESGNVAGVVLVIQNVTELQAFEEHETAIQLIRATTAHRDAMRVQLQN